MTGGGFGFGLLTDVQMLGFYQAQHSDGRKPFLAYVLQVATSSSHFLVYRRYSQIAGLAAKLHFHPPVGLPPKYALQVFPLTEAQLQQRFDGLQAFLSEVFAHLTRQHAAGLQHDASSFAGLDMQIFCDFISHHRNRPPKPVKSELPDWAKPSAVAPTMWADVESVTDSEDVGLLESDGDSEQEMEEEAEEETSDVSTQFRNEVLQAEGNLSALWHCIRAYMQATTAWWGATGAVLDEYKRVADMSLFKEDQLEGEEQREQGNKKKEEEDSKTHASRLVKALARVLETVQPEFEKKCEDAVLSPLETLNRDILPEIKHSYWMRHNRDVYSYGDNEDKKVASVTVATNTGTTNSDLTRGNTNSTFLAPRLVEELALEKALHRATITMVACGAQHSLAITDAGELYTWGSGEDGRLGHGDMRDRAVPRKVMSLLRENVVNASCGGAHTAVLTAKSTVFTFGRGRNGRLGLGDNKWRDTPHQIVAFPQGTRITHVVCGWNFTAALDREGSIFTWGKQSEGQCGLGYVDKDQVVPRRVEKLQEIAGGSPVVDVACGIYRRRAAAYKKDRAAKEKNDAVDGGREHTLALIDTDLPRTFPSLKLFDSSGPYYAFLLEVLETYACYRPDLGYIQGMSYLAAMLCLHMPQDRYLAFQCLANLMVNEHLFTFYLLDADLAGVYYSLFDTFLHTRHPRLHAHLKEIGVFSCSMYLMNWLQTLFLQVLPLELAARVFDNFLLDGTVFLFRTAMAIHELLAPELMAAEMDVALPLMQRNVIYQDTWNALVSEQSLFDTVETIAVPSHIYSALDRVVNDVFFYEKRGDPDASGGKKMLAYASGGQSVGIGHVKHERRRMYTISDALNGVLGGF
ncbi:hypothetical protein BBJ29_007719 [Phytophthora kernoviae]|uniref:Rab-GAP TBC domain-containing protein n=1 Tax=Phytophthora kernoviae TaxID=325452 RepID=A0A3R7JH00_9STRA|nr:hypothetical protein BBJ29_007719 [Phytophthora kernoviae]